MLPLLIAPALVAILLDWQEVATLNAGIGASGGHANTFSLPWILWLSPNETLLRTWLLLLGTLGVTGLILFKAWYTT